MASVALGRTLLHLAICSLREGQSRLFSSPPSVVRHRDEVFRQNRRRRGGRAAPPCNSHPPVLGRAVEPHKSCPLAIPSEEVFRDCSKNKSMWSSVTLGRTLLHLAICSLREGQSRLFSSPPSVVRHRRRSFQSKTAVAVAQELPAQAIAIPPSLEETFIQHCHGDYAFAAAPRRPTVAIAGER